MVEYLLDTDHLSYLQKHHPGVIRHITRLSLEDRLLTSVVSIGELLVGVYLLPKGSRQRELFAMYHRLLEQLPVILPVTESVAQKFAEIGAKLRKTGRPIPSNDIWIAAVALNRGAVLVTNDTHFQHIEGLKVENWTR